MKLEDIAAICHEANRALCLAHGDESQQPWHAAPLWQKSSAILGVGMHAKHPGLPPSAGHEAWLRQKVEDGWIYGPVKDELKLEHPCMVPFEQLPRHQQAKDHLFGAICAALLPFVNET